MTERDRLIELLNETFAQQYEKRGLLTADYTADSLLANGVIVPPCKVGDTVYKICTVNSRIKIGDLWDGRIVESNCDRCGYRGCVCYHIGLRKHEHALMIDVVVPRKVYSLAFLMEIMPYIGSIWFTSEEEAEKALAERSGK